jgi:hypothetical protein
VAKRGYSRAFTPRGEGKRYLLDCVPIGLWLKVQAKAKREGLSMRALILTLMKAWVEEPNEGATP